MKKLVAATAVMALFTSFANAATPATGNPGVIRFTGEIVSGACGIDPSSLDQTVPLGQVPANTLKSIIN